MPFALHSRSSFHPHVRIPLTNPWLPALPLSMAVLLAATSPALSEQAAAGNLTAGAMKHCESGRLAHDRPSRLAHYEKGRLLGEQAVAADERSADAHFSLFCNLGELMRIDGETSLSSVLGFRRMMKELDRTLELAPDHLDALSAKGTLLVRLPSLLGGDKYQGEEILRQVIRREPNSVNARLSLAKSYSAGGKHEEALSLAAEALHLAEVHHRDDFLPEARSILAQLRSTASKAN
jgi:tetratricopeptide (TPR) repeat protein